MVSYHLTVVQIGLRLALGPLVPNRHMKPRSTVAVVAPPFLVLAVVGAALAVLGYVLAGESGAVVLDGRDSARWAILASWMLAGATVPYIVSAGVVAVGSERMLTLPLGRGARAFLTHLPMALAEVGILVVALPAALVVLSPSLGLVESITVPAGGMLAGTAVGLVCTTLGQGRSHRVSRVRAQFGAIAAWLVAAGVVAAAEYERFPGRGVVRLVSLTGVADWGSASSRRLVPLLVGLLELALAGWLVVARGGIAPARSDGGPILLPPWTARAPLSLLRLEVRRLWRIRRVRGPLLQAAVLTAAVFAVLAFLDLDRRRTIASQGLIVLSVLWTHPAVSARGTWEARPYPSLLGEPTRTWVGRLYAATFVLVLPFFVCVLDVLFLITRDSALTAQAAAIWFFAMGVGFCGGVAVESGASKELTDTTVLVVLLFATILGARAAAALVGDDGARIAIVLAVGGLLAPLAAGALERHRTPTRPDPLSS